MKKPGCHGTQFKPFPFADGEVSAIVKVLSERFRTRISGFEWLNEICPGEVSADPVGDYLRFCAVASATSKKVNPEFTNQAAGGLWPVTYRKALLAAGLADHIDILPVHYAQSSGVREARANLAAAGAPGKAVWDNETACCDSTWKMPLLEALQRHRQSDWFMNNFPGELLAGCRRIVVFGGEPDACGNWSHFWSDMSPRPSAATLAVLVSRLGRARPLGEFTLGRGAVCRLFANAGRPVLVVSSTENDGEEVELPTGRGEVSAVDQQGNVTPVPVTDGVARFAAGERAYFIEGGDLEIIQAQLVARLAGTAAGTPRLAFIKGAPAQLPLVLRNFYQRPLGLTLTLAAGAAGAARPLTLTLAPGETRNLTLPFTPGEGGSRPAALEVAFTRPDLPRVRRPFHLDIIDPAAIGNRIANPDFTEGTDGRATAWGGSGKENAMRTPHTATDELGHNGCVFRYSGCRNYTAIWQNVENLAPGDYLYTAWIKAKDQETGSNATLVDAEGKKHSKMWLQVFVSPKTQEHWELYSTVLHAPAGKPLKSLTVSPLARGADGTGVSYIDNLTLSRYEGTEYNAFAPRAPGNVKIDGDLADFDRRQPVPLLGRNQLRREKSVPYRWSPANLSGVAWFNWDARNLYVGVEVLDDRHVAAKNGENANEDDSVEIALHPLNRAPGTDHRAFRFILSAAAPGGGSGRHTLFRPAAESGGLKSGSLARDSSEYEIAVKTAGGRTVYEAALPWNELGVSGVFGTRLGLSLALNDNDGAGRAATMFWGEGLRPWSPAAFGMLVLTEK